MKNQLYYGDNLEVLRKYIKDETVDLCYIDPPFNSKRNYNQIYNNIGNEDRAQAQAFIDTWVWNERANEGFSEILANDKGRFTPQTVDLLKGLQPVLKKGSLLAYLVSMTLRITEIHRVLKPTGSFYLHCDPTASHYLKVVIDAIFVPHGGDFQNELIWSYKSGGASKKRFARKHDVVFFYTKTNEWHFYPQKERSYMMHKYGFKKSDFQIDSESGLQYSMVYARDVLEIPSVGSDTAERMGYPTQKPEALLQRFIAASTLEGDVVLDAYCGCGTTTVVAQRLKRSWIGIDITYQSISLILRRLEGELGKETLADITLNGIPQDMDSARALALKQDDRVRKEFEKWAVLTYTNNRATINDKKGGDQGIDGTAFFLTGKDENAKVVFQVKSGNVGRGDVSKFNNDRTREGAELAIFLTLQPPTQGMKSEASAAGIYTHELMNRSYPRLQIVTIAELIEQHKRLDIPMSLEVLKKVQTVMAKDVQPQLFINEE
ncbi:MAG: DNA methyltransferase [Ktedonobacteraceae bacterium]